MVGLRYIGVNMKCRSQLRPEQLLVAGSLESQVDNLWFLPIQPFHEARDVLTLSIDISETSMNCNLRGIEVNGRAIDYFPAVEFNVASRDGALIPLDRDLLRNPVGCSYWDVTLSPGKVWSEVDDGGWSRAILPFQLTNVFENDTHHGIATFTIRPF